MFLRHPRATWEDSGVVRDHRSLGIKTYSKPSSEDFSVMAEYVVLLEGLVQAKALGFPTL